MWTSRLFYVIVLSADKSAKADNYGLLARSKKVGLCSTNFVVNFETRTELYFNVFVPHVSLADLETFKTHFPCTTSVSTIKLYVWMWNSQVYNSICGIIQLDKYLLIRYRWKTLMPCWVCRWRYHCGQTEATSDHSFVTDSSRRVIRHFWRLDEITAFMTIISAISTGSFSNSVQ
jgi:hypothetical protein